MRKGTNIDYTKRDFTSEENDLIKREVSLVKHKYPSCLPVVIVPRDKRLTMDRLKFLVNKDIVMGQLMTIIRKRLCNLDSAQALFLFVGNGVVPPSGELVSNIYSVYKNKNNDMLFIDLYLENTFGKN